MSRLVDRGVPAQHAASLAVRTDKTELSAPLDVPPAARALGQSPVQRRTGRPAATAVAAVVAAAEGLDPAGIDRTFAQVFARRGVVAAWSDVMVPALQVIGERWQAGQLGIESEHLASEHLATDLRALLRATRFRRVNARPVVLAAAPEEQHGLPLLALELALAKNRIGCVPLGCRTPWRALSRAVARVDPGVVFLWASMPRRRDENPLEYWPQPPDGPRTVVLGGPGWDDAVVDAPPGVTVVRVHDLPAALTAIGAAV
jgi:hypothetical protein